MEQSSGVSSFAHFHEALVLFFYTSFLFALSRKYAFDRYIEDALKTAIRKEKVR